MSQSEKRTTALPQGENAQSGRRRPRFLDTAVREGVRLLETIGIVESRQGSGNYITRHFDKTLEQVLTMMYALDNLSYSQIQEFRYAVERQALTLAVQSSDMRARRELQKHLDGMLHGRTEEEQTESDRLLHLTLVQMSGKLAGARQEEAAITAQIQQRRQENEALKSDLSHAGDTAFIMDLAREQLGLVEEGERIFYDVND